MPRPSKRPSSFRTVLVVSFFLLLFGSLFAGIGGFIWSSAQPYSDGVLAAGTVVDHDQRSGGDGTTWASVVQFETQDGQEITFVGSVSSSSRAAIGSQVRVSYRPEDPFGARNLDDAGATLGLVFMGIGLVALTGTVIGMFVSATKRLRSRGSGSQMVPNAPVQAPPRNQAQWDSSGTDFIGGEDRGF